MEYFPFVVQTARDAFAYSPETAPRQIQMDGLTITPDAMPPHYIARAIILDLQPGQMVAAIAAVEAGIHLRYPHAHSTGWRAASDGVWLYFMAWTPNGGAR